MISLLLIVFLSAIMALLVGCEDQRSTIIFGEKVCSEFDVYCHLFRTDAEQVNITFESVVDGDFNYTVNT